MDYQVGQGSNDVERKKPHLKEELLVTCRICQEDDDEKYMIKPCKCSGSIAFVHFNCLKSWIVSSQKVDCCMCKTRHRGLVIKRLGPSSWMYFKPDFAIRFFDGPNEFALVFLGS